MQQSLRVNMEHLAEYVMNNAKAWSFPPIAGETPQQQDIERRDWQRYVTSLDTAILSLVGESDIPDDHVETRLDEILSSSLFYRLPWAMEAIRVRGLASVDTFDDGTDLDDYELGVAVPALETGTLNRSAATLMQAGFTSRLAAIRAVADTQANFDTAAGLRAWLRSDIVTQRSQSTSWPTETSHEIWISFLSGYEPREQSEWKFWTYRDHANWINIQSTPAGGAPVRIVTARDGNGFQILSPDHELLGTLANPLYVGRKGLLSAVVSADRAHIEMSYVGPSDLVPSQVT
jgi:hypothetical protein